jgi:preprotein translocase subunit SecA
VEKSILLQLLDQIWKEHLLTLDHVRMGIGLRAYGQRDPLREYQSESFDLFEKMLSNLRERVTMVLSHLELQMTPPDEELFMGTSASMNYSETREDPAMAGQRGDDDGQGRQETVRRRQGAGQINPADPSSWGRVSRNAPCPCGSGRKYKHCHGQVH